MRENDIVDLSYKCQLHGVLSKKPIGHQGNKWSKRYFIIKDGFLLYYAENERKEFEKKKIFNTHPKGSIPLGGCTVEAVSEASQPFCVIIKSSDICGDFVIAGESEYERDKWLNILRQSARITWGNAQLGDAMIEQLEVQGLQMAKERQGYFDKLQYEAMALHDEKVKTEELERINEELQKERNKMEAFASELKEEYEKIKIELERTTDAMQAVADDKLSLNHQTQELQSKLEELESEKQRTLQQLNQKKTETLKLSEEKDSLSSATEHLRQTLCDIESRTQQFREEKAIAQESLVVAEQKAKQLEDDKKNMNDLAEDLKASIKDLAAQKAITESELKVEVMARLAAEKRLREAEMSLARLEKAVHHQGTPGTDADEAKEEMMCDVKTLKKFFENLAFEAQIDADKSFMIKNSIHARKKMVRRAKTMKFEESKKRRSREELVGSPVSPCEAPQSSLTVPIERLAKSTVFLSESELEGLPWMRHSIIGMQSLAVVNEGETV